MKEKATKFIALGAVLLLLIHGCVKDKLSSHHDQKNANNTINITEVKHQFDASKIQEKLTSQFNAQIKMSWLPKWENASRNLSSLTSDASYIFVPLTPHMEQNNKDMMGNEVGNRTYLMIRNNKEYFRVIYSPTIKEADKNKNATDFTFNSFTGLAVFLNLSTGKSYELNYKNGVSDYQNQLASTQKAKANSGSVKTEGITMQCHTEYICTWTTVCRNVVYVNVNPLGCSPPMSGAGSCMWYELDWFQSDMSPREKCALVNMPDETPLPNGNGGGDSNKLPKLDVSELDNFPEFKKLMVDLPNFLKKYPNIVKALSAYTGFTEAKILELMQPGKGPKIVVVDGLKSDNGNSALGQYEHGTNILKVDGAFVRGLDIVNNTNRSQIIGLLVTITTLHEFVHYGRDANGLPYTYQGYEAGLVFEQSIAPPYINDILPSNAVDWLKLYPYKPK